MTTNAKAPRTFTLVAVMALSMLTLNMFVPALPAIAESFGVSEAVMALAVSGYLIVASLLQLVIGPVSDMFGRRSVLLVCLGIYCAASLGCAFAGNDTVFLALRLVQGIVVAGPVISMAVIRDVYSQEDAASKMGTVAMAMAMAPMLGPMLGGFLFEAVGWRGEFVLYTAMGVMAFGLVAVDLHETRRCTTTARQGGEYKALMTEPLFWLYGLIMTFSVGAFYVFIAGVPFVAEHVFDLSPAAVGVGIGSITGGFMAGSFVTSRLAKPWGIHRLIILGRCLACGGMLAGVIAFSSGAEHAVWLFAATLFVGIGNGLTMANANAGATSIRPHLAGTAAGLAGALSVGGGAVLAALTSVILARWLTPQALLMTMLAVVSVSLVLAVWAAVLASKQPQ